MIRFDVEALVGEKGQAKSALLGPSATCKPATREDIAKAFDIPIEALDDPEWEAARADARRRREEFITGELLPAMRKHMDEISDNVNAILSTEGRDAMQRGVKRKLRWTFPWRRADD